VAHAAVLCTHCGQQVRAETQLQTRVGKAEHTAPPPIPAIAPGPSRFREAPTDENGRRILRKSLLMLILCAGIVVSWKAGENGKQEALDYLVRLGIFVGGACGICLLFAITFVEVCVGVLRAVLGVAASCAAGDLTQHLLHYIPLPALPWVFACMVCIFCLADLLDLDYHDAAFIGLSIYLLKVILTWSLFASMFPPQ
jgi:hypothetical protein